MNPKKSSDENYDIYKQKSQTKIIERERLVNSTPFPKTRYQGSKLKLIDWFIPIFQNIRFNSVLDAFGGTGAVSHMFKRMNKKVTYNDLLISNWYIGKALVENKNVRFNLSKLSSLFQKQKDMQYLTIIQTQFKDIYYTDEENELLDIVVQNILHLSNKFEKALCLFALFQACIQKRPFNLFHRKNLYIRLSDVKRSFGNKKTWDTPFEHLFRRAIKEGNRAVFDNKMGNQAINYPVHKIPIPEDGFDLVYIDPPYISSKGVGVDYRDFYHFLEGICNYYRWEKMIDFVSKHRRLKIQPNDWTYPKKITNVFEKTISKFQDSIIVVSYRDPGIPSIFTIQEILQTYKKDVNVYYRDYKYALTSKKNGVKETLLVAK